MARKRLKAEEIVNKLREADVLLSKGRGSRLRGEARARRVMSPIGSHVASTAESVSYRKHNTLGTPRQLCMVRMLSMSGALLVTN